MLEAKWRTVEEIYQETNVVLEEKGKILAELQTISKQEFFTKNKPAVFRKLCKNSKRLIQLRQELVETCIKTQASEHQLMRAVFGLHCEQSQLASITYLLELADGTTPLDNVDVVMVTQQVWSSISKIVFDYLEKNDPGEQGN
jgi:hypothetical protein